MQLEYFVDAASFRAQAADWLLRADKRNNLMLSVLHVPSLPEFHGWILRAGSEVKLAMLQHPPFPLDLSGVDADAARSAADHLERIIDAASGPAAIADAFAARWAQRYGLTASLHMAATFFTADAPAPFALPEGEFRHAQPEEFDLLLPLSIAAICEMKMPPAEQAPDVVAGHLRSQIEHGRQFCWSTNGQIRSIARYAPSLPDAGARIGNVYTPLEFRGQGYGSALTGSLLNHLLATGQRWVGLFADNANPTSTGIYRRLGFEPSHLMHVWRFGPAA